MDERRKEAQKQKKAITALLSSEGWHTLLETIKGQERSRHDEFLLKPLEDGNAVYRQEFLKGEIAALRMVMALPELIVEAAQTVLDAIPEQDNG